jgi:hydrogenase maturation protease
MLSMNVSVNLRPLILGIGNPLRGDDGLGHAVAERLALARDLNCEIRVVHQLTPELAQPLAAAEFAIMIDASHEGEPGEVRIRPLSPFLRTPGAIGAHHMTPQELATLTTAIYGHCPPIMTITITGVDFGMGEHLSPVVTWQVARVSVALCKVCAWKFSIAGTPI